jgi:predicted MarR family transcription regulator
VEFALTMANNAFQRWIVRCMGAAGGPAMSPLEVLIVHLVHHRERPKTLADICLVSTSRTRIWPITRSRSWSSTGW